jgi:hypothetical protein
MSSIRDFAAHADVTQVVAYTGTPANATAIGSQTYRIRLVSTTAALVSFGNTVQMYLAANFPEQFLVKPNSIVTVAQVAAAGNLYLTEII